MKKTSILIAMFAVIAAASAAMAEGPQIDFEGQVSGGVPGILAVINIAEDIKIPMPENPETTMLPKRVFDGTAEVDKTATFLELPAERRAKFREILSSGNINTAKLLPLVDDKYIKIIYGPTGVLFLSRSKGGYRVVEETSDRLLLLGAGDYRKTPICTLVEYVLWKLIDGVWTEVIKQVKECYSADTDTHGGSGSTYHSGQGGSSNYDVNKLIK